MILSVALAHFISSLFPSISVFIDSGHYVTGCSRDWISLNFVVDDESDSFNDENEEDTEEVISEAPAPVVTEPNTAASYGSSASAFGLAALVLATVM